MSERYDKNASDHSSSETLFNDDFIITGTIATVPEITVQSIEVAPHVVRTRRTERMARHATIGEVQLESRTPKTVQELAHSIRLDAVSEDDETIFQEVSDAYGELGGGLQKELIAHPRGLLREMELCSTLETYQDWYKEFDMFASSGVFEVGNAYRTMEESQRNAYFLHLFDCIDTTTNRIGLIQREAKPSVNPTIEEMYGDKTDQELADYAANLSKLRSHAYNTQVVRTMFNEFDINVDEHGAPQMPTWLLQRIRKRVQASKSRTRSGKRHVVLTGKSMTYKSTR